MCFSAGASFTAGALLAVVGTQTLKEVHKPSQAVFSCITLFFAFQQFTEGVLWTVIPGAAHPGLQKTATYIFLVMAEFIWPILIPLSVLLMEEKKRQKRILTGLLAVGAGIALFYLRHIMTYDLHAEISGRHIIYKSAVLHPFGKIPTLIYLVPTLVPFFVSSLKRAYIMGAIMFLSFVVSAIAYREYLTSVWCFFAAVMSFVIYYIIRDARKSTFMKPVADAVKSMSST